MEYLKAEKFEKARREERNIREKGIDSNMTFHELRAFIMEDIKDDEQKGTSLLEQKYKYEMNVSKGDDASSVLSTVTIALSVFAVAFTLDKSGDLAFFNLLVALFFVLNALFTAHANARAEKYIHFKIDCIKELMKEECNNQSEG